MHVWHAPWTDVQVRALNWIQSLPGTHSYTCPKRVDNRHVGRWTDNGVLLATTSGWLCRTCGYTQDWAWAVMKEAK